MSRRKNKKSPQKILRPPFKTRLGQWVESKSPVFRFAFKFVGLAALFYALTLWPALQKPMAAVVHAHAGLASLLLNLFGEQSHVSGGVIYSPQYAITVLPECTALEFACFFCAALVAFPAPWVRKITGVFIGVAALTVLNLLRIISLYWTGVHCSFLFDQMHEEIWGILLIFATAALCVGWVRWAKHDDGLELI